MVACVVSEVDLWLIMLLLDFGHVLSRDLVFVVVHACSNSCSGFLRLRSGALFGHGCTMTAAPLPL